MTLATAAIELLEDAKIYLEQLDAQRYTTRQEMLMQSTLGQHTRHFIEFFQCLFEQALATDATVNYDKRLRNKMIEENPGVALDALNSLIDQLKEGFVDRSLSLEAAFADDECIKVPTTYKRELLYNIEHTIHHMAIIKIGLKNIAPEIELPKHFGVAVSTIKFRNHTCVQ